MFSELEADLIKDRVKSGMDLKRERGELVGQPPYGWMLSDGKQSDLIPNPKEQEVIKIMKHLRNQKDKTGQPISFCKIAKELNKREFKTKLGKAWTHVQVQRVLQGKCDPKVTKGCKKSSTPTVNNSTASQIVDDADTAIQNSVNEVIPTEQNEINVSDKTEIPDSDSISKQDEQLMKDYFEFMKFKKMKESFSLGV
jgi:5'-3' exonuclease